MKCSLCGRVLSNQCDLFSQDCGGDCWGCVGEIEAELGWEPSLSMVRKEFKSGLRPGWREPKARHPPNRGMTLMHRSGKCQAASLRRCLSFFVRKLPFLSGYQSTEKGRRLPSLLTQAVLRTQGGPGKSRVPGKHLSFSAPIHGIACVRVGPRWWHPNQQHKARRAPWSW